MLYDKKQENLVSVVPQHFSQLCQTIQNGKNATTDQKAGGSNPSRRAKINHRFRMISVVFLYFLPPFAILYHRKNQQEINSGPFLVLEIDRRNHVCALFVSLFHHMGVNIGRCADSGMAETLADAHGVHAIEEQRGGHGVAEGMGIDVG